MPDITSAIEEVYMDITWGLSLYDQEIYPLNTSMWTYLTREFWMNIHLTTSNSCHGNIIYYII